MQTGFSKSAAVSMGGFSTGGGPALCTACPLSCLDTYTFTKPGTFPKCKHDHAINAVIWALRLDVLHCDAQFCVETVKDVVYVSAR